MSATTEQKVDFLLKKVGFTLSKTGSVTGTGAISGGTTKEPFAESLPSPLVVPDSSIWNQSLSIPTTPPGSDTAIVKVYSTSSALRMTADSSVSGSRAFIAYTTYNNTSSARLTDWIDTQFGTAYVLKVYKGDPNSGGTLLPAGGSGSNDGWFFDYSSGVLNFNGSGLPSGVTDSNIYIVGYRYIGSKGISSPASINPTNLYVSGISTFAGLVDINAGGQANTFKIEDLTAGRVVLAGTGGEIEDSGNLTFNGNTLSITGSQTISSNFSVTGISTLSSINVSGIAGIGSLTVAGVSTFAGLVDINAGGQANTFKVEDLTSGRVVLAGTGGEIEDSGNLTFNGSQLGITGTVNASSTITGTEFHTGASGSAIRVSSNTISGPATITLDPAAVGNNTGKVVIAGDLQVDGTTTTVNSTTVNIVDKNIQVATGAADDAAANGGGITIASGDGNKTFQFEATGDNLGSSEHLNLASGKDYKINNTSVLNATTLGSGVVNSSLTSVGTLTALNVGGDVTITDTTADSAAGPEFKLYRNSASPADADYLGQIKFAGESDTGVERNYAKITGKILDASNGTEDGIIEFAHIKAGSQTITGRWRSDSLQLLNGTSLTVAGSLDVDGQTDLDVLNVAELATFTGNIDANGSLDVDGHTELDNLGVSGVSTFTGNIDANGNLDVDGQTDLDVLNVAELATFTGNIDANGSLDVDGHTELDNLGVSGVSTFTGNIDANGNLDVDGQTDLDILNVAELATFTGNIDANGSIDVDGHTELDNLGVSGVSTFSGTANFNQVKIPDVSGSDNVIYVGTGDDLQFYHNGSTGHSYVDDYGSGSLLIRSSTVSIQKQGSNEVMGKFIQDGAVELYFDDVKKFSTDIGGVQITGVTTSSGGFSGNLTGNVTGNADTATLATDLAINGTNQIVYQSANNNSAILPTGSAGQILQSNGSGSAPQWVTSAPAGAIEGISVRDEGSAVGTAGSITTLNFVGAGIVVDAAANAGIATVTSAGGATTDDVVALAIALG